MVGYYFLNAKPNESKINYWTFPNNFCILTVNLNSESSYQENKINVVPANNLITSHLVYRYYKPIEITIQPPVQEITIYFKPLGINKFTSELPTFFKQDDNYYFNPFPDFADKMQEIFKESSTEKQAAMLEEYWLSKLTHKHNQLLDDILEDVNQGISVDSIAKKHAFTRQYISKLFQTHVGKSIAEYRKIQRFRNALQKKETKNHLTTLAHEHAYYDQSHFIKDFKELTDTKPTAFFKNVDVDKPTIWHFIK